MPRSRCSTKDGGLSSAVTMVSDASCDNGRNSEPREALRKVSGEIPRSSLADYSRVLVLLPRPRSPNMTPRSISPRHIVMMVEVMSTYPLKACQDLLLLPICFVQDRQLRKNCSGQPDGNEMVLPLALTAFLTSPTRNARP